MKKALSLVLALVLCLSLCACGNKLHKQADEVAEKLDGVWSTTWTAPLGKMEMVFKFEHNDGNAGTVEYYFMCDGDVLTHQTGTYGVSIQTDGTVELAYLAEIDKDGNTKKLEKVMENTLNYSYENGEIKLSFSDKTLVKIKG